MSREDTEKRVRNYLMKNQINNVGVNEFDRLVTLIDIVVGIINEK